MGKKLRTFHWQMELNFGSQFTDFHTTHNCSRVAREDFQHLFLYKIINIVGSTGTNLLLSLTTNKSSWADRKLALLRKTLCQNSYHKFYEIRPSLSAKIGHRQRAGGRVDGREEGKTEERTEEEVSIQQGLSYCDRNVGQKDEWARPTYGVEKKCM
jgi:hypothetical protein